MSNFFLNDIIRVLHLIFILVITICSQIRFNKCDEVFSIIICQSRLYGTKCDMHIFVYMKKINELCSMSFLGKRQLIKLVCLFILNKKKKALELFSFIYFPILAGIRVCAVCFFSLSPFFSFFLS